MRVSYLLCNSHFFEAILVFSKNLNSFSLPIFVLNRYSIDFWSLSNPSNASTLSARYSEHSSTKWVGFWMVSKTPKKRGEIVNLQKSPPKIPPKNKGKIEDLQISSLEV